MKVLFFLLLSWFVDVKSEEHDVPIEPPGTEIYLFDINDEETIPSLQSPKNITNSRGYDPQPKFSKNGQTIYYTKIRDGQADIYQYQLESGATSVYMQTLESEYSPTIIPEETGLSVIQVDEKGDQYLVKINVVDGSVKRYSDLKQVGYHTWTKGKQLHLWTFILSDQGGDLYHQAKGQKATKVANNIGRSLLTDKGQQQLYYIDKNNQPWQIRSRKNKTGEGKHMIDLLLGSEDFTLDSKGRFWTSQGQSLFVSTDGRYWILVTQFINDKMGSISRVTTNPKADKIAIVFAETDKTTF